MKRRSQQPPRRFESNGSILAIDPKAFLELFMMPESRENERVGDVAIVDVEGPLRQHAGMWCDSYDAIQGRMAEACASDAKAIVLRMDSPGGDCAGAFESARALRAMCVAAGKPFYTYVADKACSAGYALASAATHGISIGDAAIVGSIGVISTREDCSAMNTARGLRVAFIASGARKTDGHPDAPITDAELAATQQVIDSIAGVFFALVEEMRGVSAEKVAAYEAQVFNGDAAIRAGLADQVQSFDSMLAMIASGEGANMAAKTKYEEARSALEEAAKGEDANAAAAKRALAAMDADTAATDAEGDGEPGDDEAPPKKKDDGDDDEKAESNDEPDGDEAPPKKKDDDKAAAAGASGELSALAEVHKLRAEIAAKDERSERSRLIASRKDFTPEMVKALRSAPLATVREFVKTLPKAPAAKPAATAVVTGTRGANQGGAGSAPTSAAAIEMDRRMGLVQTTLGVRREGNAQVFGIQDKPLERPSGVAGGAK